MGNALVNRQFIRLGREREDNIQTDIKVLIGRESVYWIDLAQDSDKWRAVFNAVMKLPIE